MVLLGLTKESSLDVRTCGTKHVEVDLAPTDTGVAFGHVGLHWWDVYCMVASTEGTIEFTKVKCSVTDGREVHGSSRGVKVGQLGAAKNTGKLSNSGRWVGSRIARIERTGNGEKPKAWNADVEVAVTFWGRPAVQADQIAPISGERSSEVDTVEPSPSPCKVSR